MRVKHQITAGIPGCCWTGCWYWAIDVVYRSWRWACSSCSSVLWACCRAETFTNLVPSPSIVPRRRSLGFVTRSCPTDVSWTERWIPFPLFANISWWSQSVLLKSKCWQAKHIRTSSVECDRWPTIFAPDDNLGEKGWVFVYFSLWRLDLMSFVRKVVL